MSNGDMSQSVSGLIHLVTMTLAVQSGPDRPVFLAPNSLHKWSHVFRDLKGEFEQDFPALKNLRFSNTGESNLDESIAILVMSGIMESLIPSGQKMIRLRMDTEDLLRAELHKAFGRDREKYHRFTEFVNSFRKLVVSPKILQAWTPSLPR